MRRKRDIGVASSMIVALLGSVATAQPQPAPDTRWVDVSVGVTRRGTAIPGVIDRESIDYASPRPHVMLVGGLDGSRESVAAVERALRWAQGPGQASMEQLALSAIVSANPDGVAAGTGARNASGGRVDVGYPPAGDAYSSPTDPEAAHVWRWLGIQAPDLVVVVRGGDHVEWRVPRELRSRFPGGEPLEAFDSLAYQLRVALPAEVGAISAVEAQVIAGFDVMPTILAAISRGGTLPPSAARREMQRRVARSPLAIVNTLSAAYGHEVTDLVYTQTIPLIGRVRNGAVGDVERLLAPWVNNEKPQLPERPTSSHFSGHLILGELHRVTGNPRYRDMVRAVADLAFDEQGAPREAMPFHNEMSDAFFMGSPILAAAGRATGEPKYFDMAWRNARFISRLTLRPDGLHRHSPLDDTAWGRGNGFPALGLALSIDDTPEGHPARDEMIAALRAHLEALLPHQDVTGMWHQVIDHPESYREFSVTALLTYTMQRGVTGGWLDRRTFGPAIDRAWYALRARIGLNGALIDVCTSTGKMKSLRDYLDRTAILGLDPRGGGMALLVAAELAGLHEAAASAR